MNTQEVLGRSVTKKKLFNLWLESEDDFFKRVEECGGWPMEFKYVSIYHTVERERDCEFGNKYLRNEWWTTLYSIDDYLWWKLSPERKAEEAKKVRGTFANEIRRMV